MIYAAADSFPIFPSEQRLMAIEFKCQFCNAMIRVPDNAGGGKGRCPKCAMRISVPRKSTARSPIKSTLVEDPFVLPFIDAEPNEERVAERSQVDAASPVPVPVAATKPVVFDPAQLTKPRIGEVPVARTAPTASVKKRFKKNQGNGPWIIAGAIVLVLLAAAGFVALPQLLTERLTGELIAGKAATLDLRPSLIEKSRFKLSSDDIETLLSKLELNPVPLNSNSIQIQISGTEKGLTVSLAAGPQAHFYRVNLKGNDQIQKYLSRHIAELDEQRSRDIDQAATDFLVTYEKVLAKKTPTERITPFRDSLAVASLVGGFGHELVAEYGRGLYRCAYEDRDGGLYFLLPDGVKEFRVVGIKHPDGNVVVPAEFRVKVEGEIAQPQKSEAKALPTPTIKKNAKTDDGNTADGDDEMSGKK